MRFFAYILFFLLAMACVNALESNYLMNYFTMGDGSGKTMYDSHTSQVLMKSLYNWYVYNGTVINALYNGGYLGSAYPMYGSQVGFNSSAFGPYNWSVNLWINQLSDKNTYPRICVPYDVYCPTIITNGTGLRNIQMVRSGSFSSYWQTYQKDMNNSIGFNEWFMLTINYNGSIGHAYINGELMTNFSSYINPDSNYLAIFGYDTVVDELSIWNKSLNISEMLELYNSGVGIGYLETLNNGTTNQTYDDEIIYPFYYDYCIDDRLCNIYNVSSGFCTDSYSINCLEGCEMETLGFGGYYYGECINGTTILTYETTNIYNICMPGNILCLNASLNNGSLSCPYTINATLNRIMCPAFCTDTSNNYTLGSYPAGYDYLGTCNLCQNVCNADELQCLGDFVQICDINIAGCYYWKDYIDCVYDCQDGRCITYAEYIASGANVSTNASGTFWDAGSGIISDNNKFIIVILLLIAFFLVPLIIGSSVGMPGLGFVFGVVMSVLIMICATIDSFPLIGGFIPNWVTILTAFVGAGLAAVAFRDFVTTSSE